MKELFYSYVPFNFSFGNIQRLLLQKCIFPFPTYEYIIRQMSQNMRASDLQLDLALPGFSAIKSAFLCGSQEEISWLS